MQPDAPWTVSASTPRKVIASRGRLFGLACLLLSAPAVAQEGVRWQYSAPPECPSEQEFRALVDARLLRDPGASEATPKPESDVSVEVRLEPAQRRATLLLRERGAAGVERTVEGESCAELASGLAMITALAFGAAEEAAAATAAAEVPEAEQPAAPPPAVEPPKKPKTDAQAPSGANADVRDNEQSAGAPLGLQIGAGGWVNTASAPGFGLGADAFVRLAPKAAGAWSVRVAGLYGFGESYVGDRLAAFRLVGGRAEACPLAYALTQRLSAEGCAALDLGALRGRGEDSSALLEASSQTVFWAAAVVVGRVRASFGEWLSLEAQGELGLPLVRREFVFERPRERIFRIPAAGFAARVGFGVQFL